MKKSTFLAFMVIAICALLAFTVFPSCGNCKSGRSPVAQSSGIGLELNEPEHTFVIIQNLTIDTVKAHSVDFGSYVGLGRAFIFYDENLKMTGIIAQPKDRKIIIRRID